MAPKPETIRGRMRKRVATARRTHAVLEAHFDPESAAGVIVARNRDGGLVALFFEPQVTNWFEEAPIGEQDIPTLGQTLKNHRAEAIAKKTMPHDISAGAVFVYSFGATVRRVALRPDDEAPEGLAAEIHWDLGSLLLAAGHPKALAELFAQRPQLTGGAGAEPQGAHFARGAAVSRFRAGCSQRGRASRRSEYGH